MGSWNGTLLGIKVENKYRKLAEQFLECIGVNYDNCIIEEVGRLNPAFSPSIEGYLESDYFGTKYPFMVPLNKHFVDYQNSFFGEDDMDFEESSSDDDNMGDFQIEDIYHLANKLFENACIYLAHEEGNNTSDAYYRYELILDPITRKETQWDCYYDYGEGINVDSDNPRKEGTEKAEKLLQSKELNDLLINRLMSKAESNGYSELAAQIQNVHTNK